MYGGLGLRCMGVWGSVVWGFGAQMYGGLGLRALQLGLQYGRKSAYHPPLTMSPAIFSDYFARQGVLCFLLFFVLNPQKNNNISPQSNPCLLTQYSYRLLKPLKMIDHSSA